MPHTPSSEGGTLGGRVGHHAAACAARVGGGMTRSYTEPCACYRRGCNTCTVAERLNLPTSNNRAFQGCIGCH